MKMERNIYRLNLPGFIGGVDVTGEQEDLEGKNKG